MVKSNNELNQFLPPDCDKIPFRMTDITKSIIVKYIIHQGQYNCLFRCNHFRNPSSHLLTTIRWVKQIISWDPGIVINTSGWSHNCHFKVLFNGNGVPTKTPSWRRKRPTYDIVYAMPEYNLLMIFTITCILVPILLGRDAHIACWCLGSSAVNLQNATCVTPHFWTEQ